jgi:tetratricopeptide (TPR) repeat protein/transcriptional regulator with XRE-family HTH domain
VTEQPVLDFAGLLRQLRDAAGLTQEELAEAARLSTRTVSDLERGIHRSAQKDTAGLLADALGLAGAVRTAFVAAARGRVPVTEVLDARNAAAALAAAAGNPPRAAAAPVPHELPADVEAFTGRAVELAELDFLLPGTAEPQDGTAGPVVISAVSGTAGVGKTALAVRWAHRVAPDFPDGQLYVNLRGYDPGRPVPAAEALAGFLRALGVGDQDIPLGEAERAARYRSTVAGKRLLVLLDNAATAEQVRPLLPGAATVMVLVTSRDSLTGLVARDGAHRLDLDLMPAAEAVALLRALIGQRAGADPASAEMLARLCARLPLALRVAAELAAARPGTPLATLAAELADEGARLDLLDGGGDPRGAVASVFSWSYRHLPADAAQMFRLLGLHPGADWDRYAAAALTAASVPQASRVLGVLARAHLIQPASLSRYGLHDLLRAYAAGLATTLDSDAGRRAALTRLFDYYVAACAAAMDCYSPAGRRPGSPAASTPVPEFSDVAAAVAWLKAELATLTAVAAYTAGHGWPGHTVVLAATLDRYLEGGHHAEGLAICSHALSAARRTGDRAAQARALIGLGQFHRRQGHYLQAADCLRQALAQAREGDDQPGQARALTNLGAISFGQGHYQQALAHCQEALGLFRELGDQVGEAGALTSMGLVYAAQGYYQQAAGQHQQAVAVAREAGHRSREAAALTNFGEACYGQGYYAQAADYSQQALTLARELGDQYVETYALTALGAACCRRGRYAQAADYSQQALTLARELGDRDGEAGALNTTGEVLLATGEPGQAHASHTAALTLARHTGNRHEQATALARLGQVCHRQGQYGQAARYHQEALALFRRSGDRGGLAEVLNGAGETLLAAGEPGQAHASHAAALTLARETGDRYQHARAHRGLAEACAASGQPGQARQHWQDALAEYAALGVPEAALMPASLAAAQEQAPSSYS